MTEEMIVNGVDISECGFLDYHRPTKLLLCNECNSNFEAMECKDYHDCYYKQLKRLEAQNRELKACLEDFNKPEVKKVLVFYHTGELDRLEEKCEALEQENKKLKEELAEANQLKDMYHTYYRAKHDDIKGVLFKQKEKLEKIKEVAKECSIHNACISDCAYFEHCDGCVTNLFLQIIEGAEDD